MEKHPGGFEIILENANGKDSTEEYDNADHSKRAKEMLLKYYIGDLDA
jgi:cytochrome b5